MVAGKRCTEYGYEGFQCYCRVWNAREETMVAGAPLRTWIVEGAQYSILPSLVWGGEGTMVAGTECTEHSYDMVRASSFERRAGSQISI